MSVIHLQHAVVAAIEGNKTGTVATLAPMFPGFTRKQISKALANAAARGHIHRVGEESGAGAVRGVYAAGSGGQREPRDVIKVSPVLWGVNSVFALGSMA